MPSSIDALTEVNLNDLINSFGWRERPALAAILRLLFRGPARKFAQLMLAWDDEVGRLGIHEGSRRYLRSHYVRDLRVVGREHMPLAGPALVLSNHPGMTDTLCLFAAINRPDLNIIAVHNPFLASLVNTSQHLYFLGGDSSQSLRAVRQGSAHLRAGHAALTFPAGKIEPDPAVHDGAIEALESWTESAGIFMRLAPETVIVPTLVSGVIWDKTARHWLTRLRGSRVDREALAAALQLLITISRDARPTVVTVAFARPISLTEVGSTDAGRIHALVIARMKDLIRQSPRVEGQSIL